MIKNLIIVESPAKAKTIKGFLGKDYQVESSYGHVRDLPPNSLGIEVEKNFMPLYEVPSDKKKILEQLKKQANQAEMIWLATDEDREGEAISWHLAEILQLEEDRYKRIVFHEITQKAILTAIEAPRKINQNLVNAQQARRVLDRLVGFELSPLLWRKVKPALSAGRVQSVAVRLIVEREKEIQSFKPEASFKVVVVFSVEHQGQIIKFRAELPKRFATRDKAMAFLKECMGASFVVGHIETKPAKKSPAPPFTTSTLQQEASRKLNFSVARTMAVAQKLYESGKITYMRTDSVSLSNTAIAMAKKEIEKNFGSDYVKIRKFVTKTKGAQEAHEAIRPVDMGVAHAGSDEAEKRLYELIWKRTLASQMADAVLERTKVTINISTNQEKLIATGEVLKFDGFLKVYLESTDDEDEETTGSILPPLDIGQQLPMLEMDATERFTRSPYRYTEASLVKKLEELGIGRPSTYAPTISTIQKREYVVKESREGEKRQFDYLLLKNGQISHSKKTELTGIEKNKLFPTDIGTVVNSFLMEYFQNILDYNFTASVEKEFDEIAEGNKEWNLMIQEFYHSFHPQVKQTLETSEKFSGERLLGKDPKTGRNVYAKIGRFGPMIQIGEASEEEKPLFSSMRKDQSLKTITLDEALELFKLPRSVGIYENKEVVASIGRFGPYVRHDGQFFSIPKDEDPLTIEISRAIELIEEKREKERQKIIKEFPENPDIKILKGRWGPYLFARGKNYKLPKTKKFEDFSLEDCLNIIKEGTSAKKSRTTKKTTPRKKEK